VTKTRMWLGGGNNRAANQNGWSPTGTPQAGEQLVVAGLGPYTMNVRGNDLAGDTLTLSASVFTANLSHAATMTVNFMLNNEATFNLSGRSTLNLSTISGFHLGSNPATINVSGNDNLILNNTDSNVTINLLPNARLHGSFTTGEFFGVTFGRITMNGGSGSAFDNNGHGLLVNTEQATINTNVVGKGSFDVANQGPYTSAGVIGRAKIEFGAAVGSNQSVVDSSLVVIDKPSQFHASITLASSTASVGAPFPAEIDLMGLATADSYSYTNDMLRIWSGQKIIDTVHLTDHTLYGFDVVKTSGSADVVALASSGETLPGALPIHHAGI
jgi:hypothetical protein